MKPLASPPVGFLTRLLSSSRDAWPCTWSAFPRKHLRQIWYRPHLTGTKRVPHIRYMKALMQGVLHYVVSVTENSPGSFTCQGQNLHPGKGKGPPEPPKHSQRLGISLRHSPGFLTKSLTTVNCHHSMVGWFHGGSAIYGVLSQSGFVYCDIGCHAANK